MRLFLWFTLFTIFTIHFTQAGIYRRYVRRHRPSPEIEDRIGRREFQVYRPRPWPSFSFMRRPRSPLMFQSPRMERSFRFHNERMDQQRVPHFHHQPTARHYSAVPPKTRQGATTLSSWRPLDYGNPLDRDPTFDYAPPAVERVRFISPRNRRPTARSHTGMPPTYTHRPPPPPPSAYRPGPSLWKMLTHKQRPNKRPFKPHPRQPVRYHGQSLDHPLYHHQVYHDQAEIYPRIPNIVYFQPKDVVSKRPGHGPVPPPHHHHHHFPGRPTKLVEPGYLKHGSVSDTSIYSGEVTSHSEFKPVAVVKPTNRNKEYLFTVVGYKGPSLRSSTTPIPVSFGINDIQKSVPVATSTKKIPTILHAVKTTPVTISTTHNSAVKPFEPTESLDQHHNSHQNHRKEEEIEESAEESEMVEEVVEHKEISKGKPLINKPKKSNVLDILDMVPPAPLFPIVPNSFNILDLEKQDDSEESQEQKSENNNNDSPRRPVFNAKNSVTESYYKTSTSISISVSKDKIPTKAPVKATSTSTSTTTTSTTTSKPTTTKKSIQIDIPSSTTTAEPSTPQSTTPKPTKFPRLPTMPTYKKKTPVYARKHKNSDKNPLGKYSSASSSSSLSKEINGSGEIVVITAGRSKVKEYKPQFIADDSQLLSFDKIAENSSSAPSAESTTPSPSTTTNSPLQEFDPMQLLHSWFTKSQD